MSTPKRRPFSSRPTGRDDKAVAEALRHKLTQQILEQPGKAEKAALLIARWLTEPKARKKAG